MGDSPRVTKYLGLPGFENKGGEYQNTTLIPTSVGIFRLLIF